VNCFAASVHLATRKREEAGGGQYRPIRLGVDESARLRTAAHRSTARRCAKSVRGRGEGTTRPRNPSETGCQHAAGRAITAAAEADINRKGRADVKAVGSPTAVFSQLYPRVVCSPAAETGPPSRGTSQTQVRVAQGVPDARPCARDAAPTRGTVRQAACAWPFRAGRRWGLGGRWRKDQLLRTLGCVVCACSPRAANDPC